jgi:hypothetical protein
MNNNDFKNPLIQSGAILLIVFLLIALVAGSNEGGLGGGIVALFSGLVSAILFIVGLSIAIVVSTAVLITIFFIAMYLHSADRARDTYDRFKAIGGSYIRELSSSQLVARFSKRGDVTSPSPAMDGRTSAASSPHAAPSGNASLAAPLADIQQSVADLHATQQAIGAQVHSLNGFRESSVEKLEALAQEVQQNRLELQRLSDQYQDVQDAIERLASSRGESPNTDTMPGLFSYIEGSDDQQAVVAAVHEAVTKDLTYAQMDEHFKQTLAPDLYQVLADHPRLTKDYIREIKRTIQ